MRMKKKYPVKKLHEIIGFVAIVVCTIAFISCGKNSEVRKYKEKNTSPSTPTLPNTEVKPSAGHSHFHWETPEGWVEDPSASGLRLATFLIKSENKESICTIIPLQGEAGGLEPNISRWLDQINSNAGVDMDENTKAKNLQKLLDARENFRANDRFDAVILDFTPVTPNPSDLSIIVSIIKVGDNNIFIKMSGEKSHLEKNKKKFKTFCRSFSLDGNAPPEGSTHPAPGNTP